MSIRDYPEYLQEIDRRCLEGLTRKIDEMILGDAVKRGGDMTKGWFRVADNFKMAYISNLVKPDEIQSVAMRIMEVFKRNLDRLLRERLIEIGVDVNSDDFRNEAMTKGRQICRNHPLSGEYWWGDIYLCGYIFEGCGYRITNERVLL